MLAPLAQLDVFVSIIEIRIEHSIEKAIIVPTRCLQTSVEEVNNHSFK